MSQTSSDLEQSGLQVIDTQTPAAFAGRPARAHSVVSQLASMERIAQAFIEQPEAILQQLVDSAIELCCADSAGISVEKDDRTDQEFYHWIATAGEYSGFLNATLPRYPSACGVCLDRGRPQIFRVGQRFFDILGVSAPIVTDGILLPWEVDGTRGTIFVMAHHRDQAFDEEDCRTMQLLANFAAMAVRQKKEQALLMDRARIAAAAEMANQLAHQINNPLQSLTNVLFLASQGHHGEAAIALGQQASVDLERLSTLVSKLLALPFQSSDAASPRKLEPQAEADEHGVSIAASSVA